MTTSSGRIYTIKPLFVFGEGPTPAAIRLEVPQGAEVTVSQYGQYVFAEIVCEANSTWWFSRAMLLVGADEEVPDGMTHIGTLFANDVIAGPDVEDTMQEEPPESSEEFYAALVAYGVFIQDEVTATKGPQKPTNHSWRFGQ